MTVSTSTLHCFGFSALILWPDATPDFHLTAQHTRLLDYPDDNSTTTYPIRDLSLGEYSPRRQLHTSIRYIPMQSILMEIQAGDLQNLMADSSTTVRGIPIRFAGGYWARRQLHAGIKYVPTLSILMMLQAGDLQNSMADCSTTFWGIPIWFAGGCWARRQLHAGIRYVPVVSNLRFSLSSMEGV